MLARCWLRRMIIDRRTEPGSGYERHHKATDGRTNEIRDAGTANPLPSLPAVRTSRRAGRGRCWRQRQRVGRAEISFQERSKQTTESKRRKQKKQPERRKRKEIKRHHLLSPDRPRTTDVTPFQFPLPFVFAASDYHLMTSTCVVFLCRYRTQL